MQVTDEVHDGGQEPSGATGRRGPAHEGDRPTGGQRRPLVAAVVVLLLWFVWLLVPAAEPRGTAVAPTEQAGSDGLSARLFGDDEAAAEAPSPEAAVAPGTSAEPAPPSPEPAESAPSVTAPTPEPEPVVVPQRGEGSFAVAPGGSDRFGSSGTLATYTVEVEDNLPLDVADAAAVVDGVLADPRSWPAGGEWSLQRTDGDSDVRIRITSPDTADALCAPLRTNGQLSCRNGDDVVLNALRWTQGATAWGEDVAGYREYLVNHELGHYLGNGHVGCPAEGEPAPVMLQQTLGLQGCVPNGWPFP